MDLSKGWGTAPSVCVCQHHSTHAPHPGGLTGSGDGWQVQALGSRWLPHLLQFVNAKVLELLEGHQPRGAHGIPGHHILQRGQILVAATRVARHLHTAVVVGGAAEGGAVTAAR